MKLRSLAFAVLLGLPLTGMTQSSAPNYTAMWWNANESGWGLNVAHQGDVLFPMWFTYAPNGQIQWYVVSGAAKQPDGSYTGEVFRFTGKPFNQIAGSQAFNISNKVGTANLSFTSTTALTFKYTVDGITQSKNLSRFAFGTEPTCTFTSGSRASATNFTDIWWNQAESGWGLTLAHQGDGIFGLWYTYGSTGAAQWVSAYGTKQPDGSFKGDLNRATAGTGFNLINGTAATSFPLPKVGEFELRFSDGETGSFKYTLDGIEQTKQISRFVFGAPVSICSAPVTNPNPGGTASGCFRKPQVGDVRVVKNTVTGSGVTAPGSNSTERVTGTTTYEGQSVLVTETFNENNQRVARQLSRVNTDTLDILLIDAYDVSNGSLVSTTRFSPAQRFPLTPVAGSTTEYVYTGTQQLFQPSAMTFNIDYVQRFRRLPDEAVTAPIASFPSACKIDLYTKVTTGVLGLSIVSEIIGPTWTLPTVGQIRNDQTSTTQTAGINTTGRVVSELVSFDDAN
jgi:hypothetical protein